MRAQPIAGFENGPDLLAGHPHTLGQLVERSAKLCRPKTVDQLLGFHLAHARIQRTADQRQVVDHHLGQWQRYRPARRLGLGQHFELDFGDSAVVALLVLDRPAHLQIGAGIDLRNGLVQHVAFKKPVLGLGIVAGHAGQHRAPPAPMLACGQVARVVDVASADLVQRHRRMGRQLSDGLQRQPGVAVRAQQLGPYLGVIPPADRDRTGALVFADTCAAEQVAGVPGLDLAVARALPFHRGGHQFFERLTDRAGVVAVVTGIIDDLMQPSLVFIEFSGVLRAPQQHVEHPAPQQRDAPTTGHRHQRNGVDVLEQMLVACISRKETALVCHAKS